jgi:hypothetical protein
VRQQVDLGEDDQIRLAEHDRVLERLVLALGDAQYHHVRRLAEVVDRRTDQVPHVLDDQHVQILPGEIVERPMHQLGVE